MDQQPQQQALPPITPEYLNDLRARILRGDDTLTIDELKRAREAIRRTSTLHAAVKKGKEAEALGDALKDEALDF